MNWNMEQHLIRNRVYDKIIIRRTTLDGCVAEDEFMHNREDVIVPKIEIALRPGVTRRYVYQDRRIESRRSFAGEVNSVLVVEYVENDT